MIVPQGSDINQTHFVSAEALVGSALPLLLFSSSPAVGKSSSSPATVGLQTTEAETDAGTIRQVVLDWDQERLVAVEEFSGSGHPRNRRALAPGRISNILALAVVRQNSAHL